MGRMKALPPRLKPLPPRLGAAPGARPGPVRPWRRLYDSPAWKALRWAVCRDAGFRCARCGYRNAGLGREHDLLAPLGALHLMDPRRDPLRYRCPELHGDHVVPHRGDESLFWDRANLQCLCQWCHAGAKQREELAAR